MLRLTPSDPIDKLLQHIAIRHPRRLTGQIREFPTRLVEAVSLVRFLLSPFPDHRSIILAADLEDVFDVDAMPEDPMDDTVQCYLARLDLFLVGGKQLVWNYNGLVRSCDMRRCPDRWTFQRTVSLTNRVIREAKPGCEVVVAICVHPFSARRDIAAETFLWIGIEGHTQSGEIVRTHSHHGSTSKIVIEVDIILTGAPPGYHGA